jgi:hypothetical protein
MEKTDKVTVAIRDLRKSGALKEDEWGVWVDVVEADRAKRKGMKPYSDKNGEYILGGDLQLFVIKKSDK